MSSVSLASQLKNCTSYAPKASGTSFSTIPLLWLSGVRVLSVFRWVEGQLESREDGETNGQLSYYLKTHLSFFNGSDKLGTRHRRYAANLTVAEHMQQLFCISNNFWTTPMNNSIKYSEVNNKAWIKWTRDGTSTLYSHKAFAQVQLAYSHEQKWFQIQFWCELSSIHIIISTFDCRKLLSFQRAIHLVKIFIG